jgi:hypothetical protein
MIAGVSPQAAARSRAAQPFHLATAEETLTWVVQELNNTDKHRVIPMVRTYTSVGHLRMTTPEGRQSEILPPVREV